MAPADDDLATVFDAVAETYAERVASRIEVKLRHLILESIRSSMPRGSSILDVGSGPGTYAIPLARDGYKLTAVDISPEMIRALDESAGRANVSVRGFCMDARDDLSQLGPHDAALAICGPLSYSPDPEPIVVRMLGALSRSGRVWLAFPRAAALEQLVRDPGRGLRPLASRAAPHAISIPVGSSQVTLFIHHPTALERRLDRLFAVQRVLASSVIEHAPEVVDRFLGRLPVLRRLGAVTIVYGMKR